MAIFDSMCERYGITLRKLLDNYSMPQIVLISHIAYLKMEDGEREIGQGKQKPSGQKRFLNQTNEQAYMLIAGGVLG